MPSPSLTRPNTFRNSNFFRSTILLQPRNVPIHAIPSQRYGTRAGSAIPAVRFNCMSAQTFNVVVYGQYTDSCKLPSASITKNCNYSRIEQQQRIHRSLTTEHELKNTIGTKIWKKIRDGKISGGSLWSECFKDFLESHAHLVGPFPASSSNDHQNHRT